MTGPRPQIVRAYSLVEMIVVISIIALLLALAGIGVNSVVHSRRVSATQLTMQTIETAIREFEKDRPVEAMDIGTGLDYPRYQAWFNHLPPSPVTPWSLARALTRPPGFDPAYYETDNASAVAVAEQFTGLTTQYMRAGGRRWRLPDGTERSSPPKPTEDYASIECLVLFLTQFSPNAKAIIDKLPAEQKPNKDNDRVLLPGDPSCPLIEITDSWGKPLRWAVIPFDQSVAANQNLPVRWELRSAGKDGVFSRPFFTPADQSDDVVWPKGSSR